MFRFFENPRILRHKPLAFITVGLVSLKLIAVALPIALPGGPAIGSEITAANIVLITNRARGDLELPALAVDMRLERAAQAKADEMARQAYFAHVSPSEKTAIDHIVDEDYRARYAAENLAVHFTNAEALERSWLTSPDHRSNIVNALYRDIGVGISYGTYKDAPATFVVQLFGREYDQTSTTERAAAPIATMDEPRHGFAVDLNRLLDRVYAGFILLLSAVLLLMLAARFHWTRVPAMAHAMAVIGFAFVLMIA